MRTLCCVRLVALSIHGGSLSRIKKSNQEIRESLWINMANRECCPVLGCNGVVNYMLLGVPISSRSVFDGVPFLGFVAPCSNEWLMHGMFYTARQIEL